MEASLYERRVLGEWQLLLALAERNPGRIAAPTLHDGSIALCLLGTPARLLDGSISSEHELSIGFPLHYPAVPMTLHLTKPVQHPNVHPLTGFVCLWATHKTSNTVEHALHKTVAIFAQRLLNSDPVHVMQPEALTAMRHPDGTSAAYMPLQGVETEQASVLQPSPSHRSRLS